MKKRILLVSMLLFTGYLFCGKRDNNISIKAKCCGVSNSGTSNDIPCTRGKKGRRGKRGPRGPNGTSITCGLGELFTSPNMMAGRASEAGSGYPPDVFFSPYVNGIATSTIISAWLILPANGDFNTPIGVNFNIPDDLDLTQPVTAVVHILVTEPFAEPTGNQARLEVQTDYQPNNGLLGSEPPATGLTLQYSDDFTIVFPTPGSGNLIHIAVPVVLDTTDMANGDWAFLAVKRAFPADPDDDFDQSIYLSTISLQYTRICS